MRHIIQHAREENARARKREEQRIPERLRPENRPVWFDVAVRAALIFGLLIFFPRFVGGVLGIIVVLAIVLLIVREMWH